MSVPKQFQTDAYHVCVYVYAALAVANAVFDALVLVKMVFTDKHQSQAFNEHQMAFLGMSALGCACICLFYIASLLHDYEPQSVLYVGCYLNCVFSMIQISKLLNSQSNGQYLKVPFFSCVQKKVSRHFWMDQLVISAIPFVLLYVAAVVAQLFLKYY